MCIMFNKPLHCHLKKAVQEIIKDKTKFVWVVRPVISPIAVETQIFAGETVQLFCTVPRGDLPISTSWFLNGERLAMRSSGMTTTQVGPRTLLLAIHSATAWNSGNYTCLAENSAGTTEYTVPLLVHGAEI